MKKIYIAFTIIMFFIILTGIYFLYFSEPTKQKPNPNPILTQISPLPTLQVPDTDSITINTSSGKVVVKNFLKKAINIFETSVYLTDKPEYKIIFSSATNDFLIRINTADIPLANKYRTLAEVELMDILAISQTDLCKLNVHTDIPFGYSETLSNLDFGLSFCPNSKPIQ